MASLACAIQECMLAFSYDHCKCRNRNHFQVSLKGKEIQKNWINKNLLDDSVGKTRNENRHDRNHKIRYSNLSISIGDYSKHK